MKKLFRSENGAVAVFVVLGLAVLLGCAALTVDLGSSYHKKVNLQDAVDNAAYAAGSLLPSNKNLAVQGRIEAKVEETLRANGVDPNEVEIIYEWDSSSEYYYALRVTAVQDVPYGFAKIFGEDKGQVSATAKASAEPISSTFSAIAIYIEKEDFENQMDDMVDLEALGDAETLLIKYNGPGTSHGTLMNMGLMRVITDEDAERYEQYEDIHRDRFEEFFENGYYGLDEDGNKCGLCVGDTRYIENNSSFYNAAFRATNARMDRCKETCGANYRSTDPSDHSPNCPRFALIPVCDVDEDHCGNSGRNNENGEVTVDYFISVFIKDTYKTKGATVIEAAPLDTERELTGTVDTGEALINTYMVCGTRLEE